MCTPIRLVLVGCALLLAACTSSDAPGGMTVSTSVHDAGAARSGPALPPASSVEPTAVPTLAPPRTTTRVADQLRRYLDRALGEPSQTGGLHRHIRQVSVGLHVASIHTDLSSDELDKTTAEQICLVASWFRTSPEGRHVTALDVEVYGQAGDLIATYVDEPALASSRGNLRIPLPGPAMTRPPVGAPSPTPGASVLDGGRVLAGRPVQATFSPG